PPSADAGSTGGEGEGPAPLAFLDPPTDKGPLGRLDCLHIRKELGQGRFGVVYEAVDGSAEKGTHLVPTFRLNGACFPSHGLAFGAFAAVRSASSSLRHFAASSFLSVAS